MNRKGAFERQPEPFHIPDALAEQTATYSDWWLDVKRVLMRDRREVEDRLLTLEKGTGDGDITIELDSDQTVGILPVPKGGTGIPDIPKDNLIVGTGTPKLGLIPPPPEPRDGFFLGWKDGVLGWWSREDITLTGTSLIRVFALNYNRIANDDWTARVDHAFKTIGIVPSLYRTGPSYAPPHRLVEADIQLEDSNAITVSATRDLSVNSYLVVSYTPNIAQPS